MNAVQALEILDRIAQQFQGTRQDHQNLATAVAVLREELASSGKMRAELAELKARVPFLDREPKAEDRPAPAAGEIEA